MSPTSVSVGEHLVTGGEYISRLVETLIGRFCLRQNLNNGVIIISSRRDDEKYGMDRGTRKSY